VRGVLVDAGALIALLDVSDNLHDRAVQAMAGIRSPLYTVWPAFTEAVHLIEETPKGPDTLCDMVDDGVLGILPLERADMGRMKFLLQKYRDLPMDFADAALVRVAEREGFIDIVSFDKHFRVYRLPRRGRFNVLP